MMSYRGAAYEVNKGACIVGMDATGVILFAVWTDLKLRLESSHEGIKQSY